MHIASDLQDEMIELLSPWIITGDGSPAFPGSVCIEGVRIRSVNPSSTSGNVDDLRSHTLDGFTILPGLIDAHSHLGLVVRPRGSIVATAVVAALIFENARVALEEGFTTVRDAGGLDGGLVRAIDSGLVAGPRVLPSGPLLSPIGGHADWRPAFDYLAPRDSVPGLVQPSVLVDGVEDMLRAARTALRDGATQLKLTLSGGFSSDGDQLSDIQFGLDEVRAAVEVAHGRHTYVTAHAHHAEAVRLGLRAGVECFEHGTFLDDSMIKEVQRHKAVIVATLSCLEPYQDPEIRGALRPELAELARNAFPSMARMVKMAVEAGVTVGSGSDLSGPGQSKRALEIAVRSRVTNPLEAIHAATAGNASILRLDDQVGCLRENLAADLIAIEGDVATNPEILQDPSSVRLVVRAGKLAKNTLPEPLGTQIALAFETSSG